MHLACRVLKPLIMNIQTINKTQFPDLAKADYKFHWGFAIGGIIFGLATTAFAAVFLYAAMFALAVGNVADPPAPIVIMMLIGLVGGIVAPFLFGYLFGKIGGQGASAKRQNETLGLEPPPSLWYGTRGRINRQAFLAVYLVVLALLFDGIFAAGLIDGVMGSELGEAFFFWLVIIAIVGAGLSPIVRRLHDLGFSGWFAVMLLIPFVGQIYSIPLFVIPGNPRLNKYGAQPQEIEVAAVSPDPPR